MGVGERHRHRFVANTRDGIPRFVCNRVMWRGYRAAVMCVGCTRRTWVTRAEWERDRADGTPDVVRVVHPDDGFQRETWRAEPTDIVGDEIGREP